jgi:hypothetical protein
MQLLSRCVWYSDRDHRVITLRRRRHPTQSLWLRLKLDRVLGDDNPSLRTGCPEMDGRHEPCRIVPGLILRLG